jgi:LacI family transcriptional regulator
VANIHDVARLAGVSATTAKRAIREPHLLAPETLERVRRAVESLHYEPDQIASALRRGHNRTVGLIIGSIVEPFFATLTRAIGNAVHERGYNLIVADSEYEAGLELQHLKEFSGYRVAGLILRAGYGEPNLDYLERMQKRGTAIVEIDHVYPSSPFSQVMLDNRACVFESVHHLYALGHRRIAALGAYHPRINPEERSQTFVEALRSVGLEPRQDYTRVIRFTQREAYELSHYLLSLEEPPTALFALTGSVAIGAFRAIRERGLRVPEDVSLLAFDNYEWTALVEPGIDVIEQPVHAMGLAAVETLFRTIDGSTGSVVRQRFAGTLIRRGSCAPPGTSPERQSLSSTGR